MRYLALANIALARVHCLLNPLTRFLSTVLIECDDHRLMATTKLDGSLPRALLHAVCLAQSLGNGIRRNYRFYRFEDKGCFNDWGDEGEFFELHWLQRRFCGGNTQFTRFQPA